jgi:hypothetical protein
MSGPKESYDTLDVCKRLMDSMTIAIDNMIAEVRKPVDQEINGSARKAELQSIKQTAVDCKELIVERQRLSEMIKDLESKGTFDASDAEFSGGFAEKFSKRT